MSRVHLSRYASIDLDAVTGHVWHQLEDDSWRLRLFVGFGMSVHHLDIAQDDLTANAWGALSHVGIDPPEDA